MHTRKIISSLSVLLAFLALLISVMSCYYDNKEYLFPSLPELCDTTQITFSGTVQPVLGQYCLSCHSNTTAPAYGANIRLEDYSDVLLRAEDGSLVGAISHDASWSPMPKGASQLDECIITGIRKWVELGSPDN